MPVFGFAVDHESGATDYVVALGDNIEQAHAAVLDRFSDYDVTVEPLDLEDMLSDQYECVAILSTESGGPTIQETESLGDLFTAVEEAALRSQ